MEIQRFQEQNDINVDKEELKAEFYKEIEEINRFYLNKANIS